MWQKLLKNNHIKTLNLEQLGVQEMDAREVKGTDGGFITMFLGLLFATIIMDGFTAGHDDANKN